MPYQLFVDESGTAADETFLIAGLAARGDDWHQCCDRWRTTLHGAGWASSEEVHWHDLAGAGARRRRERDTRFLDALFDTLGDLPITCFAVAIKTDAARKERPDLFGRSAFGADAEMMYREALAWLLERYQRVLDHSDSCGSVLLDSRVRRQDFSKDEALRSRIEEWLRTGRSGTTPDEHLDLDNLLESIRFEDSRAQVGLQMVDLVAGCTRRCLFLDDPDSRRWFGMIEPRFARHPVLDDIDGTGLVRWPRSQKQRHKPQSDLPAFER